MMICQRKRIWLFVLVACGFLCGYFVSKLQMKQSDGVYVEKVPETREEEKEEKEEGPKKYFLDCGGNVASSVLLFRETYPDAHEYIIHSFEIDEYLKPFFIPFTEDGKSFPHIPMAVSDTNGHMTAYLEAVWYPGKLNQKSDKQWGGGSLYANKDELVNADGLGGERRLSRQIQVPMVDLSEWIQHNTRKEDYVILKLDVEGAEYGILKKMLAEGTFDWIDKFYGELHGAGAEKKERDAVKLSMKKAGVSILNWAGERRSFDDFDNLIDTRIPDDTPGSVGHVIDKCETRDDKTKVTIIVEVGMNAKPAKRLIGAIAAHNKNVPLTLFLYGDFVEQNADLVKEWSQKFDIGVRAGRHVSDEYWLLQNAGILRMDIVSAWRKFEEVGLTPAYIFPSAVSTDVMDITKKMKLRVINSTFTFPPRKGNLLTSPSYFQYRDVERTPKALKLIYEYLEKHGGILSLDSDFPDSFMISAFLLDYLYEISSHEITNLHDCLLK